MDPDILLVIGVILGVFAIPSIFSAFSEGRAPRVAAITLIAAASLIVWAVREKPGGYALEDVPAAFVRVVATYIL